MGHLMKNKWCDIKLCVGDADNDGQADVWLDVDFHGMKIEHRFEVDFASALALATATVQGVFRGAAKK
jgi:hypothetical protein